jgi:hypothetical protein
MLTKRDRKAGYKAIQEVQRTRAQNIRYWRDRAGGWTQLGKLTGMDPHRLMAVAGPNPTRQIGEMLARDLETNWGLPKGWLDMSHGSADM